MNKKPIPLKLIIIFAYIASFFIFLISIVSFFQRDLLLNDPKISSINPSTFPEVFLFFGILMLIVSIIYLILAIGLSKNKNWARLTFIILCIINIIGGVFSIFEGISSISRSQDNTLIIRTISSVINLLVNLIIGSYLLFNKKVKAIFLKHNLIKEPSDKSKEAPNIIEKEKISIKHKDHDSKEDIKKLIDESRPEKKKKVISSIISKMI